MRRLLYRQGVVNRIFYDSLPIIITTGNTLAHSIGRGTITECPPRASGSADIRVKNLLCYLHFTYTVHVR